MEQPSYLAIDHIAYATRSTQKTAAFFTALGFEVLFHRQPIEKFGVLITKLRSPAGEIVEVVEPSRPDSVVSRLLVNVEACLYHAACRVNDLQASQVSPRGARRSDSDHRHVDTLSRHSAASGIGHFAYVPPGRGLIRDHGLRSPHG